jgi:hypothetical protein
MDRATAGRLGAYVQHARHDATETTRAARAAFEKRFELQVDPDGALPPDERLRRARAARKAYYQRLSHAGHTAKKRKKGAPPSRAATPGD